LETINFSQVEQEANRLKNIHTICKDLSFKTGYSIFLDELSFNIYFVRLQNVSSSYLAGDNSEF